MVSIFNILIFISEMLISANSSALSTCIFFYIWHTCQFLHDYGYCIKIFFKADIRARTSLERLKATSFYQAKVKCFVF